MLDSMKSSIQCYVAIFALTMLSSCRGGAEGAADRPTCTPVSGILTFRGTPVAGATVTLHPETKGYGAFGISDYTGKFVLTTFKQADGVVPANYKISVRKLETTTTPIAGMDSPDYDPNAVETPAKDLLPVKYSQFTKSGLSVTVEKTPITDLKLDLVE